MTAARRIRASELAPSVVNGWSTGTVATPRMSAAALTNAWCSGSVGASATGPAAAMTVGSGSHASSILPAGVRGSSGSTTYADGTR